MDHSCDMEFLVEELPDGRLNAYSVGACIHTIFDSREELRDGIRDAVCCHFDPECRPRAILLRFVEVVREEELPL